MGNTIYCRYRNGLTRHTVNLSTWKETAPSREAVSIPTKTTCDEPGLTGTPLSGAPAMYGHMSPLQMRSLIKRDSSSRSSRRACMYRSRQLAPIDTELTVRQSSIGCWSTIGFEAVGYCAIAEPEPVTSPLRVISRSSSRQNQIQSN